MHLNAFNIFQKLISTSCLAHSQCGTLGKLANNLSKKNLSIFANLKFQNFQLTLKIKINFLTMYSVQ